MLLWFPDVVKRMGLMTLKESVAKQVLFFILDGGDKYSEKRIVSLNLMYNESEFLDYIALHAANMRYRIRKNITYDDEIFDDVWNSTLIKCYDNIKRGGSPVKDPISYFFVAFRREYFDAQADMRKHRNRMCALEDYLDIDDMYLAPAPDEEIVDTGEIARLEYKKLYDYLTARCGQFAVSVWQTLCDYRVQHKRCNYRDVAAENDTDPRSVKKAMKKIRECIAEYKNLPIKNNVRIMEKTD